MAFDGSDLDAAIVGILRADPELTEYCPDGVYFDIAPPEAKRFVIVSLIESEDVATFEGRAIESALYLVVARMLSTVPGNARAAAARIDAVLEDEALWLPSATLMEMHRTARVRSTEVDELDPDIRWQHRGGQYRVIVATEPPADPRWIENSWIDN